MVIKDLWKRLRRRTNAMVIEGAAHGLVFLGLAWLFARLWSDENRRRISDA